MESKAKPCENEITNNISDDIHFRGAIKIAFRKRLGIWPNKGWGGLTETQVFVEIFQNQICLGN